MCSGGQLSPAACQQVRQKVRGSAIIRDQLQELCRAHLWRNHDQGLCHGEEPTFWREQHGSDTTDFCLVYQQKMSLVCRENTSEVCEMYLHVEDLEEYSRTHFYLWARPVGCCYLRKLSSCCRAQGAASATKTPSRMKWDIQGNSNMCKFRLNTAQVSTHHVSVL